MTSVSFLAWMLLEKISPRTTFYAECFFPFDRLPNCINYKKAWGFLSIVYPSSPPWRPPTLRSLPACCPPHPPKGIQSSPELERVEDLEVDATAPPAVPAEDFLNSWDFVVASRYFSSFPSSFLLSFLRAVVMAVWDPSLTLRPPVGT